MGATRLVPGVAALAMLVAPPMPGISVVVPVALAVVAIGSMAILALGRRPRQVDLAVLSPLLALWPLRPPVPACGLA